jgi:hypothetical protein
MTNLVNRLRDELTFNDEGHNELRREAADEIERLQQLLRVADDVGNKAAAEIKRLQHAWEVERLANQPKGDVVRSAGEPKAPQCTGCFLEWPIDADGWHSVPETKHHRFKCITENRGGNA